MQHLATSPAARQAGFSPRSDRSLRIVAVLAMLAVAAASGSLARSAVADPQKGPAYRVNDPSLVYLGNPRQFKKPCVVDADRVYRAIPEYQEILQKNLTDRDVRYHFLMKKASDKFSKAIRDLARDFAYDLVAGAGAVSAATPDTPPVPDETQNTISRLPA